MFKFGHRIVNNSILQLTKFWGEYIMYVRSLFINKVESFLDLSSSSNSTEWDNLLENEQAKLTIKYSHLNTVTSKFLKLTTKNHFCHDT